LEISQGVKETAKRSCVTEVVGLAENSPLDIEGIQIQNMGHKQREKGHSFKGFGDTF